MNKNVTMNNITIIKKVATAILFVFVAYAAFAVIVPAQAIAFGSSEDGGCCGGPGEAPSSPSPEPETPSPDIARCDYLNSSATTVASGSSVTLNWGTTGAHRVELVGYGNVSSTGSQTVTVNGNTTFVVRAYADNTSTCQVTVNTTSTAAPTCDAFTASPTHFSSGGGTATLSWNTTNATSVSINNGVGSVAVDGSTSVSVSSDVTYTLTATGAGGTDTCTETITVGTVSGLSCDYFNSSPSSFRRGGSTTLSWGTTNATSVSIDNGIGSVAVDGSTTVSPSDSTTYTLTASDAAGNTVTCSEGVSVTTGGGGGSPRPSCDLEASDTIIVPGQAVTLSWDNNRNTYEATIYEGDENGDEIFEAGNRDEAQEGSIRVYPTQPTTYTMVTERGKYKRSCDIDIEMEDTVILLSTRDQEPRVAGISLTQVPYTGFEAGPFLTLLFYILLAMWGMFVAYIFTVKEDKFFGFSLAGAFPKKKSINDLSTSEIDETEHQSAAEAYLAEATEAPVAPNNLPTVGYASHKEAVEEMSELEEYAHKNEALISSDVIRFIERKYEAEEQLATLDKVIVAARKNYPSEDGWVILNLDRVQSILDDDTDPFDLPSTPVVAGSLAEAIIDGNLSSACGLIGHRPMVALMDAATDLDALYRERQGGEAKVSNFLREKSANLTNEELHEVIKTLTTALDGTYQSENEAVKVAIMKAIKLITK
tara:strand:+ start:1771 stop:3891 length:2121 start_codon:yes stop_codon:yes gene_type:complete